MRWVPLAQYLSCKRLMELDHTDVTELWWFGWYHIREDGWFEMMVALIEKIRGGGMLEGVVSVCDIM